MPSKKDIIKQLKDSENIFKRHNIERVYLCGSYARSEQTKSSDLDIFVESTKQLWAKEYFGLLVELEKIFNMKVDVMMHNNLRTGMYEYIKKDLQQVI